MFLRKRIAMFTAAGLAFVGLSAAAQSPKRGGTLNFAVIAEPPNYDCHGTTTFAVIHPVAPHYSLLLKYDPATYPKIVGDLAQSWTTSPDGLVWTFKLHPNVTFHDGSSLTSTDVKASYDRIANPPEGVLSIRKAAFGDVESIETPDAQTVIFKLKLRNASMLQNFASPFNCIYSAKKLAQNPRYPETEILGSGPFSFVENVKGSHWIGKRYDGYFRSGQPYLDGYKIFFVKSTSIVPGMLGGQFDAEFRARSPVERDQLLANDPNKWVIHEAPWVANMNLVFNTTKKPFDDIRVRQALSMAIDRWGGSAALSKIVGVKGVGGVIRPGYEFALSDAELVKLPGFSKDAAAARTAAQALLKQAGIDKLNLKLVNRAVGEPFTSIGVFVIDQWRRIGITAEHQQLESKAYFEVLGDGKFEVGIYPPADPADDPNTQFAYYLSSKLSPISFSRHTDTRIDDLFAKQSQTLDVVARKSLVNELDRLIVTQSYNVPIMWYQRIIAHHQRIKGWHMTPSNFLGQDLAEVWLDQ